MSNSSVIGDVTQTLEDLLVKYQQPTNSFEVSLQSPADEKSETGMKAQINLFLFRVVENPYLKGQAWEAEGTDTLRYPPLALDLFYVLTPFAEDKLTEHRVLGEAMRILHDFSLIIGTDLKGALANTDEELQVDLWQLSMEDLARIWSALIKPYRLSVGYVVRNVLIDSQAVRPTKRVLEQQTQFTQVH